jgi:excinuclease ABC subunit A
MGNMQEIEIVGAKKHNLKNINLKIPKNKLITLTGVSGSGKSSLAYDTLFFEGQRKYLESMSIYARQLLKSFEKPDVEMVKGISPTISIDQKISSFYFNSTVGTISEISSYLRLLYAKTGQPLCPQCGKKILRYSTPGIIEALFRDFPGKLVYLFAPLVRNRKGNFKAIFEKYIRRGFLKAQIDGEIHYLDSVPLLNKNVKHQVSILIDAVEILEQNRNQIKESVSLCLFESNGELVIIFENSEIFISEKLYCPLCDVSLREPQPASFSLNSPLGACGTCKGKGRDTEKKTCVQCGGKGYNKEALSFLFRGKSIFELGEMEVGELLDFFNLSTLDQEEKKILNYIMPQILGRLETFTRLNLGYISLNRKINTISGGELQRSRLVSQIGSGLCGIIYILDEPSVGMHLSELESLIRILKELKQKKNTIIVVEHDESTIRESDFIVELGPGAGDSGGEVVFSGWISDFKEATHSLTSDYLFGRRKIKENAKQPPVENLFLEINRISINNLNDVDIKIPLKSFTAVTGVSGSGKSSLMKDACYPIMKHWLTHPDQEDPTFPGVTIKGAEKVDRILMVDQSSVGANSRSCPATYIDIMPFFRELFAGLTESRIRGYKPYRFSFNVAGGRCEACKGLGIRKLDMGFLPAMEVKCPVCDGKRFHSETLMSRYEGLSIFDVLELTLNEAYEIFRDIPYIAKRIRTLSEVGLGYLKLGQSTASLSGGESQRMKLGKELSKSSTLHTVYILDEPTKGLHFDDIRKLLEVLNSLIRKGNTVIIIEHNLDLILEANYIVDLGPGGGKNGGRILYQGELEGILDIKESSTAFYLNQKINEPNKKDI